MTATIKVGLIGIGGMGRTHFACYKNNSQAQVVAICDVDERKRQGDWSQLGLNIGASQAEMVDLSGIKTYAKTEELIADADVQLVDICLPTPLHATATVAALKAGKHVFCEKPMAMTAEECAQMEDEMRASGRQLMIGHCLRYWPHYVRAHEIIHSGEFGRVLYARFHRSGDTPRWSWNNWLGTPEHSGGAVFDMHIHDADTALWWFGRPQRIEADGLMKGDLPMNVDATWSYDGGPLVYLHGAWDDNGGPFRYAFKVVMERATIVMDSATGGFQLLQSGAESGQDDTVRDLEASDESAYQNEIDDFIACLVEGRALQRITPEASRLTVEVVLEQLAQIKAKNDGRRAAGGG